MVCSWQELEHRNVARVLALCHGLPPIGNIVIIDCSCAADLLMTYLRKNVLNSRVLFVSLHVLPRLVPCGVLLNVLLLRQQKFRMGWNTFIEGESCTGT